LESLEQGAGLSRLVHRVRLEDQGDVRGSLAAIEAKCEFPFPIERVRFDYGTLPEVAREDYANLQARFGYVCLVGSCTIDLDDGHSRESARLASPLDLLVVERMVWKVLRDFSPDCMLLVLSDRAHDPADLIRDYEDFLAWSRFGEDE
jgi:hypothetical protein